MHAWSDFLTDIQNGVEFVGSEVGLKLRCVEGEAINQQAKKNTHIKEVNWKNPEIFCFWYVMPLYINLLMWRALKRSWNQINMLIAKKSKSFT